MSPVSAPPEAADPRGAPEPQSSSAGAGAGPIGVSPEPRKAPRFAWIHSRRLRRVLAIIGIALASLPRFHAFGSAPSQLNTWVAYFPFVWLPAGLVSSALLGHVVLWRRLLQPH